MGQPATAMQAVLPALRPIITADSFEARRKALRTYLLASLAGLKTYFRERLAEDGEGSGDRLCAFDCKLLEVAQSNLQDAVQLVSFIESGEPLICDMQRNSLFKAWQEHLSIRLHNQGVIHDN